MNTKELMEWTAKNNIEERTIQGFWNYFNNWEKEDPDDFYDLFLGKIDRFLINIELKAVQLTHVYNYGDFVYCTVAIRLLSDIIASYKMVFTLDGDISDDTLDFEDINFIKKKVVVVKNKVQTVKKSITEGLEMMLISKITNLELNYVKQIMDNNKQQKT